MHRLLHSILVWVAARPGAAVLWRSADSLAGGPLHVLFSTDAGQAELYGLHGALKSAVTHSGSKKLSIHILCPASTCDFIDSKMPAFLKNRTTLKTPSKNLTHMVKKLVEHSGVARTALESPFNMFPYYAGSLLPDKNVQRLLYMDSDVLAVGDVSELSRVDMGGYAAAAVEDCQQKFGDTINWANFKKALRSRGGGGPDYSKITPETCGLNRGVFLMDIPTWDRLGITKEIEWWLQKKAEDPLLWHNGVSQPPWMLALGAFGYKRLPKGWNVRGCGWSKGAPVTWDQTQGLDPTSMQSVMMLRYDLAHTRVNFLDSDTKVLHFNGRGKPWLDPKCGVSLCAVPEGSVKLNKAKCPVHKPTPTGPQFVDCADIWRSEVA